MELTLEQLAEYELRATMAERERCALIAEEAAKLDACSPTDRVTRASRAGSIAAAIRNPNN